MSRVSNPIPARCFRGRIIGIEAVLGGFVQDNVQTGLSLLQGVFLSPPGPVRRCKKYELSADISAAAQRIENWLYANA